MEIEKNVNRNNHCIYGATNDCTPFKIINNNELNVNVMQNNNLMTIPLDNTINKSNDNLINISNQTNDRVSESAIYVTEGSNGTHSRLGLPFCNNRYKPSEDVISNDDSIYTVRNDSNKTDKPYDAQHSCWWTHPQVKSHWRVFLAAFGLLIVGIGLIAMGIVVIVFPEIGFQSYVFFIAGIICFIPGAYHVVYVYFAVKGKRGYEFHQLPLFN